MTDSMKKILMLSRHKIIIPLAINVNIM